MKASYTYLWEFEVPSECAQAFEAHYGPSGSWVQLFRRSPHFVETLLLKDKHAPGRYLTVDRWRSDEAFAAFRAEFAAEYAALDAACKSLTASERSLGEFSEFVA